MVELSQSMQSAVQMFVAVLRCMAVAVWQGLPSPIMPHGMVETPHGVEKSLFFLSSVWLSCLRACTARVECHENLPAEASRLWNKNQGRAAQFSHICQRQALRGWSAFDQTDEAPKQEPERILDQRAGTAHRMLSASVKIGIRV